MLRLPARCWRLFSNMSHAADSSCKLPPKKFPSLPDIIAAQTLGLSWQQVHVGGLCNVWALQWLHVLARCQGRRFTIMIATVAAYAVLLSHCTAGLLHSLSVLLPCLLLTQTWSGQPENWEAAQKVLLALAQANSEAQLGVYKGPHPAPGGGRILQVLPHRIGRQGGAMLMSGLHLLASRRRSCWCSVDLHTRPA